MSIAQLPGTAQAPMMSNPNLTPQQRLALALMQNQQQGINQRGSWAPANGAASLFNGYLTGQLMKPQPQQQNPNLPQLQAPQQLQQQPAPQQPPQGLMPQADPSQYPTG